MFNNKLDTTKISNIENIIEIIKKRIDDLELQLKTKYMNVNESYKIETYISIYYTIINHHSDKKGWSKKQIDIIEKYLKIDVVLKSEELFNE